MQKPYVTNVDDFFSKDECEFAPADLKYRLREDMNNMRERDYEGLPNYVCKFRHVVTQVREMSKLDQIMYFLLGLTSRTREEVHFRRCTTLSEAITVALDFDRSHPQRHSRGLSHDRPRYRSYDKSRQYRSNNVPEPIDISNVQISSRDGCRRRNLCFKCGSPNNRSAQCSHRQPRNDRGNNRSGRYYQQHVDR